MILRASEIAQLRKDVIANLLDTCSIYRRTARQAANGQPEVGSPSLVTLDAPCGRIRIRRPEQADQAGGTPAMVVAEVQFGYDADVQVKDELRFADDENFVVTGKTGRSLNISQRVSVTRL